MKKLKEIFKKYDYIIIPLIFFFVTFLIFNFLVPNQGHDAGDFHRIFEKYEGGLNWVNLGRVIVDRFLKNNSRITIETLAVLFVQNSTSIIIFRLINPIMATISFYLILKILDVKSIKFNMVLYLILFAIDGTLLYDVGLTSVCTNYLWPVAFATPAILILYKSYSDEDYTCSNKYFAISIILIVIYSLWQEMFALMFLFVSVLFLILYKLKYKTFNYKYFVFSSLAIAFLLYSVIAPGNRARYQSTIDSKFPGYASFTFFSKCWFGLVETYNEYLKLFNLILVLVLIYVYFKDKNYHVLLKVNACMPLLHFILYNALFNSYVVSVNSGIKQFYVKYFGIIRPLTDKVNTTGVPFLGAFFALLCFAHIFFAFLFLKIDYHKKAILISTYAFGVISKFGLGFTPRYYATYRTSFFVVLFTYFEIAILLKEYLYENKQIKSKKNL